VLHAYSGRHRGARRFPLLKALHRKPQQSGAWLPQQAPPPPVRVFTQPNGRWRSVIAPGESIVDDHNYLSPVIGEVGFTLFFDTTVSFSPLINVMTLVFTKPSGDRLEVSYPGFFAGIDLVAGNLSIQHGFVAYIFGPGDLDEAGWWSVFLARGGSRASGIAHFRVLNPIERLELAMPS
jgi:hypothetical protein